MCENGAMDQHGVAPAMAYTTAPPSTPFIHLPAMGPGISNSQMRIVPSFESVDSCDLTQEDMAIITQGQAQIAEDKTTDWRYDMRRTAQPILDFLYLGPAGVLRDTQFLVGEGFTMLLAVRDARLADSNLMDARKVAARLGIASGSIDVSGSQELIHTIPNAIRTINNHLVHVYRSQAVAAPAAAPPSVPSPPSSNATMAMSNNSGSDRMVKAPGAATAALPSLAIDPATFRRGKVLVFCESGNGRSAILVAAYLMTIYGLHYVKATQFINMQRFCTSFDDDAKHLLHTYHDILVAKRQVGRAARGAPGPFALAFPATMPATTTSKRRCDEMSTGDSGPHQDHDVTRERGVAPFVDTAQQPNADIAMQD